MKTAEELNALREEVETLNRKLAELSEEELRQVAGGRVVQYVRCSNPECSEHRWNRAVAWGRYCWKCGSDIEVKTVEE